MSDLKPCPFCGCKAEISETRLNLSASVLYTVSCINKKTCFHTDFSSFTKETAVKYWNTRPAEDDAKDREIERLKADNQVYRDMLNSLLNEEVYHLDNATMTNIKYDLDNRGTDTDAPANAPDTGKMEEN